jgi:Dyp-type peroxidase family
LDVPVQQIEPPLDCDDIQGNILAGFNKDHQTMIFFRLPEDLAAARYWLAELSPDIASTTEVKAFNDLFKLVNTRRDSRHRGERGTVEATWVNVGFTHAGLARLQAENLDAFPAAFREGMAARASDIGDVGDNAPEGWFFGATGTIDGVIIVAADSAEDQNREITREHRLLARHGGVVVYEQPGRARTDLPGHEHFGFKDGISQPGIRGFTEPSGPDPDQGQPGQDLIWPGEFILGYPRQKPAPAPGYGQGAEPRPSDLDPAPGEIAAPHPDWTLNGSYLVVRRLRQDVPGFLAALTDFAQAQNPPSTTERIGAKLVGRYRSGAPLEPVEGIDDAAEALASDPSGAHPELLQTGHINDFDYRAADSEGHIVPLAAHIRKAYPRNEATIGGGEADTQTHRLLRRGIPFGKSYKVGAPDKTPHGAVDYPLDRGLVFACYQTSIEQQFEFVQSRWVNDPNFPTAAAGQDPVISQDTNPRSFSMPDGQPAALELLKQWVTTTGGEYFFQPSISALKRLSDSK